MEDLHCGWRRRRTSTTQGPPITAAKLQGSVEPVPPSQRAFSFRLPGRRRGERRMRRPCSLRARVATLVPYSSGYSQSRGGEAGRGLVGGHTHCTTPDVAVDAKADQHGRHIGHARQLFCLRRSQMTVVVWPTQPMRDDH
ncbi:hypothetical protein M433DRAFT_474389 [Acidomyces richmondensis BFW]|nr:hypothetical protein M433DRAFT_474389 [Acidomyces richmondensis BFW]